MTGREALARVRARLQAEGLPEAALEAEVIIREALNSPRERFYTALDEGLVPESRARIEAMTARRLEREPLAYITGHREFYGLELTITADVLVPRPETEHLVEEVLSHASALEAPVIADIGTGSGAIALAVARALPEARVFATDLSRGALALARRNAVLLGLAARITFLHGDLTAALREPADVIAANLPYVPTGEIARLQPEIRDFEPLGAFDGGPDGLALIRRLLLEAPAKLLAGGRLVLELGAGQAGAVCAMAGEGPLVMERVMRDLAGLERVVTFRRA